MSPYLIVGLGNPGEKYAKTRHNLGFLVVSRCAQKWGLEFKREWRLKGKTAAGVYKEKKVILLQPATYMNLSGESVRRCALFYKVPLEQLLVAVDDVYVKFGAMRLRPEGSSGGHNGLKSIEQELGTQNYCRLRLGVGNGDLPGQILEEYVLANFTPEEQDKLPLFIENAVSVLEMWLDQGTNAAMQCAGNLSKEFE